MYSILIFKNCRRAGRKSLWDIPSRWEASRVLKNPLECLFGPEPERRTVQSVQEPWHRPRGSTRWYSVQGEMFWAFRKTPITLEIPRVCTVNAHSLSVSDQRLTLYTKLAQDQELQTLPPPKWARRVFAPAKPNVNVLSQLRTGPALPSPTPTHAGLSFLHRMTSASTEDWKTLLTRHGQDSFHSW